MKKLLLTKIEPLKRLGAICLIISMVICFGFTLSGCGSRDNAGDTAIGDSVPDESVETAASGSEVSGSGNTSEGAGSDLISRVINIAALNGPTGMGAVKLMDMTDKYNVETYQAPTDIVPKLISGEIDCACLPSNMAAVLYNKTGGEVVSISPMVMGVLHILGNNVTGIDEISDLKGMTIISSGQGGTPEYALEKILADAGLTIYEDVNVEWLSSHADVNTKLLAEDGTVAMVPEPFVSVALVKGSGSVTELFDINEEWKKSTGEDFPMGVLVARRDFIETCESDMTVFLDDLQASIDEVNKASDEICQLLVDKGFFADVSIAQKAIPNCSLTLYCGDKAEDGREMMRTFNETMYAVNPQSIGGEIPGEDLYY